MKEKMWLVIGTIFAVGVVAGMLMRILSADDFVKLALIVVMAVFNEARLSSNNKEWGGWTEDAAKQAEARYQALAAMYEKMMAQFQKTVDSTAEKAATAAVEKGAE